MRATYCAMRPFGRMVTLMGIAADDADLTAYNMNLTIHSVMMLTPMWLGLEPRLRAQTQIVRDALTLVAEGALRIIHSGTFSFHEVAAAHAYLEAGEAIGKVTLKIG